MNPETLQRRYKILQEALQGIVASDRKHGNFAVLIQAAAREALEFADAETVTQKHADDLLLKGLNQARGHLLALDDALRAATAYVELYTANGTREHPPAWAAKFDADAIAKRCRAVLNGEKV